MSRKFRLPIIIGSVITIIVLAAVLGSMALAQDGVPQGVTGGEEQVSSEVMAPVPGGPGFISVPGTAFQPFVPTDQFGHVGPGVYCISGNCDFTAEIYIPNGATITKLVVYYYDNVASDLIGRLVRGPFSDVYGLAMAETYSSGTGTINRYVATTTIATPVIDNQSNAYLVEVYLPPSIDLRLVGMRVDYAYPTGLPLVEK